MSRVGTRRAALSGTQAIQYLLLARFTADIAAPLPASLPCDVGGPLTVVDTENKLSQSGGKLVCAGGLSAGNPGLWGPAMARVTGRTAFVSVTPASGTFANFGFDTNTSGASAPALTFATPTALRAQFSTSYSGVPVATTVAGTPYLVATVLRPQGAIYLVKGGAFINWTLLWVDESNTGSNVYPAISDSALAFTCDYLRVRDLPGAWQQDYGIALARVASPAAIVPELGEELVSNGNMEAGDPPTGWSISSAAISSVADERTGGSGSRSLGVARTEAGDVRTYQVLSTSGATGRWYHLSAWLRNVDSSGGIRVYLSNLPGAEYATTGYVTATDWSNRILTTRATDVALLVRVMVNTSIAGQSGRADDISVKPLSLPSCLGSAITTAPEGIWECTPTLTTGTQAGMMLCIDDTANPANFILAYHDGTNAVLEKCVGGTYTTLVSAAATYSAGARLIVRKYGSEVTLFYNNAAVGVAQTVSDVSIVGNTKHALFSTYETNTFGTANGGFVHWPAYPGLPSGV